MTDPEVDSTSARRAVSRLRWWRELLVVGGVYLAYELARGLVSADVTAAITHGRTLLDIEQALHIDPERWLNAALTGSTLLSVVAAYFYAALHYLITPIVLVWMYRAHPSRYRFARTWLVASTALGMIGYALLPTAPPRLLGDAGFVDVLASVHRYGWWGGEASVPRGLGGLADQFAAMPSLHVGWAVWCGFLLARYARHRIVRVVGAVYPLATTLVVMATGNHYLLDAIAGVAVMGLGALIAAAFAGPSRSFRYGTVPSVVTVSARPGASRASARQHPSPTAPPVRRPPPGRPAAAPRCRSGTGRARPATASPPTRPGSSVR